MNKERLISELTLRGVSCSEEKANELLEFMNKVLETNEKFNLTAIKNPEDFIEKMIFDSALGLVNNDLTGKKVIDVGTGAGFPGMVLYILNPEMNLTLLDSTSKKINYLLEYGKEKGYTYSGVATRAEDFSRMHREEYDYAFARAVAPLNILLEIITPLLKVGGTFIAMKGPGAEEELNASEKALKKLGCRLKKIYSDNLPISDEQREIIYIVKDKATSKKYPRSYNEIKKLPL